MPDKEIWKPIPDYPGYEVSNLGKVRSLDRYVKHSAGAVRFRKGALISAKKHTCGYLIVRLAKNGKGKNLYIHRLVAQAFIPNLDGKKEINHIDGDKQNNKASNLEWCTRSENAQHAFVTGLNATGEKRRSAKFTNEQVKQIRKEYIYCSNMCSYKTLALKYGVSRSCIRDIVNHKTYKDVK